MDRRPAGFKVMPFPTARKLVVDAARQGSRKHVMYGLFEVDVTEARRRLHARKARTGEALVNPASALG